MVTILKVGIDGARKRFTTVSKKPAAKTAAQKSTTKKASSKPSVSTELPSDKRPVVTFHEDGTITIENMSPRRGRQSDYSKAQQLVIDQLTEHATDLQKRLNGLTKDYEGAKEGFDRAQRWHTQQLNESRQFASELLQQNSNSTRISADCSFIIEATQLLTESFTDVKLVSKDTGYNTAATWQIGELQIDFIGGRIHNLKAISTEKAEEQIVPQNVPLGRGFGELTAISISFIRDLLRAITHEGKKSLSKQSAYASWFPSALPQRHKGEALRQVREQYPQTDNRTNQHGASFNLESLMDSLDDQSHHRSNQACKVSTPDQDVMAQADDPSASKSQSA